MSKNRPVLIIVEDSISVLDNYFRILSNNPMLYEDIEFVFIHCLNTGVDRMHSRRGLKKNIKYLTVSADISDNHGGDALLCRANKLLDVIRAHIKKQPGGTKPIFYFDIQLFGEKLYINVRGYKNYISVRVCNQLEQDGYKCFFYTQSAGGISPKDFFVDTAHSVSIVDTDSSSDEETIKMFRKVLK